jgi:hypothetical protein
MAKNHGDRHLVRALDGGLEWIVGPGLVRVHAFADDDGVVHENPEDEDEREQRDHVDRHAEEREARERAGEGDRDAERDPERQAHAQEHGEQQQDQREAHAPVAQQDADAPLDDLGGVA